MSDAGMFRGFIAVALPDELREVIATAMVPLRGLPLRVSWVRPENLHITLRFLGDIPGEWAEAAREGLCASLGGCPPVHLALKEPGAFPNFQRPSVLWLGVEERNGSLAEIQRRVEAVAVARGLAAEQKAFHPHITLGRIRGKTAPGAVEDALVKAGFGPTGDFWVRIVSLFSSTLNRGGAVYERLEDYPLAPYDANSHP